jgi:exodeoxyribonuclease VII large subunit
MTEAAGRVSTAPGSVAAEASDEPAIGVLALHQRIGQAITTAFPARTWVCGEVVGEPVVRAGGTGIAFSLGERNGDKVTTVRAWLGRPYYQALRRELGDEEIAELLTAGAVLVIGGQLQYGGPFHNLELRVDRVVRTSTGVGQVSLQRQDLQRELGASGLLGHQRRTHRLRLAPLHVAIVAGGAGTVGYRDAIAVFEHSGFRIAATHYPTALEGERAPERIAAQIRAAAVGDHDVILVVRGGGEDAQLSPFDSAAVVTAIADAPLPVITGIGHSHHDTLADAAAYQACVSPADAARTVIERLGSSEQALRRELAAIHQAAHDRQTAATMVRRVRRIATAGGLAILGVLAFSRTGWIGVLLAAGVAALALALLARRRPPTAAPRLAPQPAASTFEAVIQELGAIRATLQDRPVTAGDVSQLLQAATWLEGRGRMLLGLAADLPVATAGSALPG